MDDLRKLLELRQYKNGKFSYKTDVVIRETNVTININSARLTTLSALPQDITELAVGYLYSEGLIKSDTEINKIESDFNATTINIFADIPEKRLNNYKSSGTQTSGCGSALSSLIMEEKETNYSKKNFKWEPENILAIMMEFQKQSDLFHQTGGVHSAALVHNNEIITHISDIGRHNAVDKVAGKAIIDKVDLTNCYLVSSGRISSEIMRKIVRLKIPLIVSHSAPTSEAVRIGWQYNATIIGFTRSGRFNQYTCFG